MMIVDLSNRQVKEVCNLWSLHQVRGRKADAPGVVGRACVHGSTGEGLTTPIVAVDPRTHRFLTASGSVYQVGVPNMGFAIRHPQLLRELGM